MANSEHVAQQTYRERYRPLIDAVIERVGTSQLRPLREALRAAFPDPPRECHPYKIWLDEIREQLKLKKRKPEPVVEVQATLFADEEKPVAKPDAIG